MDLNDHMKWGKIIFCYIHTYFIPGMAMVKYTMYIYNVHCAYSVVHFLQHVYVYELG